MTTQTIIKKIDEALSELKKALLSIDGSTLGASPSSGCTDEPEKTASSYGPFDGFGAADLKRIEKNSKRLRKAMDAIPFVDPEMSPKFKITGRFEWNSEGELLFTTDPGQPPMNTYFGSYWYGSRPNPFYGANSMDVKSGALSFAPTKRGNPREFQLNGIMDAEFTIPAMEFIKFPGRQCQNCDRMA